MINPLWITNYASKEDLLYDNLPCHSTNFFKCPNSVIEKSEASEAYIPSFPTIPIPTSASKIIPTSLPPSPIAAILLLFVYFLRRLQIFAFYVGLHLQTQTHGAFIANSKNSACNSSAAFNIVSRLLPSIMRTELWDFELNSFNYS